MKMRVMRFAATGLILALAVGCASMGADQQAASAEAPAELASALAAPTRSQEDKVRDADRKPAELLAFLGVKPGMSVLDAIAAGGYLTEVLSFAVGPTGAVYSQNPPAVLKFRDGLYEKAITNRLANKRLPNVRRVDADLPADTSIPPGTVDVAITAMNLHDLYNRDPALAQAFAKGVYQTLKPGGVFGVIDHVGVEGADNAKLHRMPKQAAIDLLKAAGFTLEAESQLLANPADDHTKGVFDASLRGKTDQFVLKMRKPK